MPRQKFIVDLMLGNLARYLRILGYDTLYPTYLNDDEIIIKAKKESRVIITRDKGLYERAVRVGAFAIFVESDKISNVLRLLHKTNLIKLEINFDETRCPRCNYPLKKVSKPLIKPHPSSSARKYYFICEKCGSIYWIGSHWKGIIKTLEEAKK